MMMMNSISSKMIVLTALVCLWITPTFSQSISIQQTPNPVAVGQNMPADLTVSVNGGTINDIQSCNWYKGYSMSDNELIGVYVRSINKSTPVMNPPPATVSESCALHFNGVTQNDIANYILYAQFNTTAKRASRVLNGAKRFEISSIVLLAAAGLISSFTLF